MVKTTKHQRKSGATTVKKDGKIVGNIGSGKTNIPTVNMIPAHEFGQTSDVTLKLSAVQKKFKTLQQSRATIDSETAITLWELTSGQDYGDRLITLDNSVQSLSSEECEKVLQHIDQEMRKENAPLKPPFHRPLKPGMTDNGKFSKMLSDKKLSPFLLDAFAHHDRMPWKVSIAMNPYTQCDTLDYLADYNDDCENVGDFMFACIGSHKNTTTQTLIKLYKRFKGSQHKNITKVLGTIAENFKTPQNIVEKLANRPQSLVRSSAAMNTNASPELLTKLSTDSTVRVKSSVADNYNTPTQVLDDMSRMNTNAEILWNIADNKNSSTGTLNRLTKNANRDIAIAAKYNLRARNKKVL